MPTKEERREQWAKAAKDKVILHMFQRSKVRPNGSPFVIKLETFLRMAKIEYEPEFEEPMSTKGKSPWITFNGEDFSDSQFCIEMLSEKLGKDLNKGLSEEKKAVAKSMRIMMEDHLYWCLMSIAFVHQKGKYVKSVSAPLPVPAFLQNVVFGMMTKNIGKQAHAQGIGRHGKEEVEKLALADLKALSVYLGDKNYLMGKEPTEVDATLFGFLCLILAGDPEDDNVLKKAIDEGELGNLKTFFKRMKEKYWADWEECFYVDLKAIKKAEDEAKEKERKEKEEKEKKEKEEKEKKERKEKKEKEEKEKKEKEEKEKKEKEEKEKKEKEEKEKKEKEKKDSD